MNMHLKPASATGMTAEEWEARVELAAVYRLCHYYGWGELIYNHCSHRVPGEPNKIMFLDLPLECTIKIYTETLELIKTIDHYGSGDEAWGVALNDHMTTETGQLVVSGLYIAHIETPDGESTMRKFVIVR